MLKVIVCGSDHMSSQLLIAALRGCGIPDVQCIVAEEETTEPQDSGGDAVVLLGPSAHRNWGEQFFLQKSEMMLNAIESVECSMLACGKMAKPDPWAFKECRQLARQQMAQRQQSMKAKLRGR